LIKFILPIGVKGKEKKNLQAVGMINHKKVGCVSEAQRTTNNHFIEKIEYFGEISVSLMLYLSLTHPTR